MENKIIFKLNAEVYNDEGACMDLINEGLLCLIQNSSSYFLQLHNQNKSCIWKCKLVKGMIYKKGTDVFYKLFNNNVNYFYNFSKFSFYFSNGVVASELNLILTKILDNLPDTDSSSCVIQQSTNTSTGLPDKYSRIQPEVIESIIRKVEEKIMPYIDQLNYKIEKLEEELKGRKLLQNMQALPSSNGDKMHVTKSTPSMNNHIPNTFPNLQSGNVIPPPPIPPPLLEDIISVDAQDTNSNVVMMPKNLLDEICSKPKLKTVSKDAINKKETKSNSKIHNAIVNHPLLSQSSS